MWRNSSKDYISIVILGIVRFLCRSRRPCFSDAGIVCLRPTRRFLAFIYILTICRYYVISQFGETLVYNPTINDQNAFPVIYFILGSLPLPIMGVRGGGRRGTCPLDLDVSKIVGMASRLFTICAK